MFGWLKRKRRARRERPTNADDVDDGRWQRDRRRRDISDFESQKLVSDHSRAQRPPFMPPGSP